jgi:hypothetical protein
VQLNRAAIDTDYQNGLRWLNGGGVSGLRAQARREALTEMRIDPARLHAWFEANGGARAYGDFLAAREQARLALNRSLPASGAVTPGHVAMEMDATTIALQQLGVNLDSIARDGTRVMLGDYGPPSALFTSDLDTALALVDETEGALHHVDIAADEARILNTRGSWHRLNDTTAARTPTAELGSLDRINLDRLTQTVHGHPATDRRALLDLWVADRAQLATGVLPDVAVKDAAQVQLRHLRSLVADQNDRVMNDAWQALAHRTLDDEISGVDQIKSLFPSSGRRPAYVQHPNMVTGKAQATAQGGRWQRFTRAYFDQVIGRSIDTIIRNPMYWRTWMDAFQEVSPHLDQMVRMARTHPEIAGALDGLTDDLDLLDDILRRSDVNLSRMTGDEFHALASENGVTLQTIPIGNELPEGLVNYQRAIQHADQAAVEGALTNTLNQVLPFIDDHRFRSMFAVQMRGLMPFFFAEEQFIKRWMRTLAADPASFRRAQLTMQGIRDMGWVHTDEHGNEVFYYPGGEYIGEALAQAARVIPGVNLDPELVGSVSAAYVGQTAGALPGARSPIGGLFMGNASQIQYGTQAIGVSPIITIPLNDLVRRMPENRVLTDIQETIVPEAGRNRGILASLLPSTLTDLGQAFVGSSDQLASARLQAIQQLIATGQAPSEVDLAGNPVLAEQWFDQVDDAARVILGVRAVIGYVGPARPQVRIDEILSNGGQDDPLNLFPGYNLGAELASYSQHMPWDEAVTHLIERYGPEVAPYTVFQTQRATGAPLPATEEWLRWQQANSGVIDAYPLAATWFGPLAAPDDADAYSQQARLTQLTSGLRVLKSEDEFVEDIFVARASGVYWEVKDLHDAYMATETDPELRRAEDTKWSQWSATYRAEYPVFGQALTSGDARLRRSRTIDQMTLMLTDRDAPPLDNLSEVGMLHEGFIRWRVMDAQLRDDQSRIGREMREAERISFVNWAQSYAALVPAAAPYWNGVLRIEVNADEVA